MRPHCNLASLLAVATPVLSAQFPYSATTLLTAGNGSITYVLDPGSGSQASLGVFNASGSIAANSQSNTLFTTLPFLSSSESKPYIPLVDDQGITVLTGDCDTNGGAPELWRFAASSGGINGTWTKLKLSVNGYNLKPNYLSAGVAFPASDDDVVPTLYAFGGMCPSSASSTASDWIADANYSSQMLALSPATSTDPLSPYSMAAAGLRAPPIPEAGLTMTPLAAAFSGSGPASQQQNFVLIGGHTQNAFINMSQPQENDNTELVRRDSVTVEPRSGHTAVLTQDGTQIVVVGGWVGDTNTPAQPQVAVLNVGEDYGGRGDLQWSVPTTKSPFSATSGIYGHGATLLQGGVMMVAGGFGIGSGASKAKRQSSSNYHFLNTTSMEWSTSYTYPSSASGPSVDSNNSASSGLNKSEKVGIGAGVGLSFAAIAIIVSVWFWYSRRIRRERYLREKELRELALGAERSFDPGMDGGVDQRFPERRSASWADMQEKSMQGVSRSLPWNNNHVDDIRQAERTGAHMDVPSPTRGLRKNLQARPQFGQQGGYLPGGPPGSVFRIDEEEENSQSGSLRKVRTPQQVVDRSSAYSDPFKDPPRTADSADDAAEQRKKEVQSWVEDWQSAAESMLSRNPSQAQTDRTYSNLSQAYAPSHARSKSNGSNLPSGRGSPEKSDRTGSNLSEQSVYSQMSFQRSTAGTVSRKESQRSASAGQAIFSGAAAAALGRLRGQPQPDSADPEMRERTDTFSSSPERRSFGPIQPGERHALLGKLDTQFPRGYGDDEETSPTKATREVKYTRTSSLTSRTGAMAMGLLGSVKRVITGTGSVNVHDRVAAFENKSGQTSPTKTDRDESPKRPLSPSQEFWKGKQGPQDWGDASVSQSTGTVRRKPLPNNAFRHSSGDAEEWDVESAVQNRVVQVMFTMPKEKLRVVNADALSLLSSNQSDIDHEEAKDREKEVKRMSSVREADEPDAHDKGKVLGCDVD
ncbi:uncharacterized protein AB675_8019 [Cyphellophora attinorum]|uniref:Uncharacterized protein n=1 Tax=Cyphellophora attinorum TaxID=1664694 RepID=A0A0N1P017_9EURO|nr:uncharacterized protein AB675_8019 [Phialophora attinorum]KPI41252.1 hypothetical protein AB675_8019 [Phialophora attinorum]